MTKILHPQKIVSIPIRMFIEYAGSNLNRWQKLAGSKAKNIKFGLIDINSVGLDENRQIKICSDGHEFPVRNFTNHFFESVVISMDLYIEISALTKYKEFQSKVAECFSRDDVAGAEGLIDLHPELSQISSGIVESEKEKWLQKRKNQILGAIQGNQWEYANHLFQKINQYLPEEKGTLYRSEIRNATSIIIEKLLQNYDFAAVKNALSRLSKLVEVKDFDGIITEYQDRYIFEKKKEAFIKILGKHFSELNFIKPDEIIIESNLLTLDEYQETKAPFIQKYFHEQYNLYLDKEQSKALSIPACNLLIKARAGSGKTRVLACKTALLIERYRVNPDHILVLAFNKKAANEVRDRIRNVFGFENFDTARTFHSLAYQLYKPKSEILFDNQGELSKKALSIFVQEIIRSIWSEEIQTELYKLFRKETTSFEQAGGMLSSADYLAFIRNKRDVTLNGDRVKSTGEKFIADYLFERDIPYFYERVEFWSGHTYRPDFTLFTEKGQIVIEYWGIDTRDPRRNVPKGWGITWEQYAQEIIEKRRYWEEKNVTLIELSIADLRGGPDRREQFEKCLEEKLAIFGIKQELLPKDVLEKKVIRNQKDRMTELFVQFIQRSKKRLWSIEEVQNRVQSYTNTDERVKLFLKLGCIVYSKYQSRLASEQLIDFDDLMGKASSLIRESKGECSLDLGLKKDRHIKIKDIRWILVDEFQDFSQEFDDLLAAIIEQNLGVHIGCVGDDWQAINRFAGSDLKFIQNFKHLYPDAHITKLLTNHRSQGAIVEFGNTIMAGHGEPGVTFSNYSGGHVDIKKIDDVWIETRNDKAYEEEKFRDERFIFYEERENGRKVNDNGYLQAKYLKACFQILTDSLNKDMLFSKKSKTPVFAILSRSNTIYRVDLKEFLYKLKACFSSEELKDIGDFEEKVRISTVHSFKGLEAEVVIILRACDGSFPLLHPDNSLFEFFGQTEQQVLDEERRLFYVGVSRPTQRLYILTEKDFESSFIPEESYIK